MDPTITSDEKVQVRFTVRDVDGTEFTDALYFTPVERAAITPDQLVAMQMERFTNWKASITQVALPVVDAGAPRSIEQQAADSGASLKATVLALIDNLRSSAEAL